MSYVDILLTEGLRILSHHVGQVPPADVELLHLLLDKLQTEFFGSCGRQVLSSKAGSLADLPAKDL